MRLATDHDIMTCACAFPDSAALQLDLGKSYEAFDLAPEILASRASASAVASRHGCQKSRHANCNQAARPIEFEKISFSEPASRSA